MSSLVKRLRIDAYECEEQHGPVRWSEDLKEAADSIEALKEALREIAAISNRMYGQDWQEIEDARAIARVAMNGEKE